MQIRTLELYCRVADLRSFSEAARAARVSQGAVSQAIQSLEDSVGAKLIDRSRRPLVLTDAGRVFVSGARSIVRQHAKMLAEVQAMTQPASSKPSSPVKEVVRVGCLYSIGISYMPEAAEALASRRRNVKIETRYGHSQTVVQCVLDGSVDFGLVSYPRATAALGCINWQTEPMRLVCSPDHPLADQTEIDAAELDGMEMYGFESHLVLRHEIDNCLKAAGIAVTTLGDFDNADSLVRAIQRHRGVGMVPESAVRRETAEGKLRIVGCRQIQMVRPLGIIYRRRKQWSEAAIEMGTLLLGREISPELRSKAESARADRLRDENRTRAVSSIA